MFLGVQRQAPPNVSKSLPFGSPMFRNWTSTKAAPRSAERSWAERAQHSSHRFALADKCEVVWLGAASSEPA